MYSNGTCVTSCPSNTLTVSLSSNSIICRQCPSSMNLGLKDNICVDCGRDGISIDGICVDKTTYRPLFISSVQLSSETSSEHNTRSSTDTSFVPS